MTLPESSRRALVSRWLDKADEDRELAAHLLAARAPYLNALGFHAQQAVEKYPKPYLVARQIGFPKTHSIEHLLDLVATRDATISERLRDAVSLSGYGTSLRYPTDLPDLTVAQAERAVALAQMARDVVASALRGDL